MHAKKPRRSPLRLRFLTYILEEISYAICITYFPTIPYEVLRETYKRLVIELTEKQLDVFEEYFSAVMETMAITEKLAYKQGIADFINVLY